MVMKKRCIGIILAFLFLLTACSSAATSTEASYDNNDGKSTGYGDQYEEAPALQEGDSYSSTAATTDSTIPRKIIKDASMGLKAKDVDATYADILQYAAQFGGYEFSHEKTADDDSTYIKAVIKIKPEGLEQVMNYAGESAKVISSSVTSDDITASYYDTKIRLQTVEKTLEKYYQFLADAKTVEDMLKIQSEINTLTLNIESYKGQLKMWDALVAESTLTLSIYQIDEAVKVDDEVVWNSLSFSDMGRLITVGFSSVINSLLSILEWIAIVLASISPLLIIIAVIIIVIIRKRKKNQKPPKDE